MTNYGATCSGVPARESLLRVKLSEATKQAEMLEETVKRLQERFCDLTCPTPTGVSESAKTPEPSMAPLVNQVHTLACRINGAREAIQGLLDSAQL